jgi:cytochrome c553
VNSMSLASRRRLACLFQGSLLAGAIALVFAVLWAWAGVYSVAASRGHWAVVEWALAFVMRNSVETHALGIKVPQLEDANLVVLGAAQFYAGCAVCHGAPNLPASAALRTMLPPPPDLAEAVPHWKDRELFWIVKHGIKYTGMPAWASLQRDDEVWAMVAFLKRLPGMDAGSFRKLAFGEPREPPSGRVIASSQATEEPFGACMHCHGADGRGPRSELAPVLHGQPAEFLAAALQAYAEGKRQSGIMRSLAADLAPAARERVAAYYAQLPPPSPATGPKADAARIERGKTLALEGDAGAQIPPCMTCHGGDALKVFPRLAGQNAGYMVRQVRLWKTGLNGATDTGAIMAPIAMNLNDQQIEDVSAYFASLTPSGKSGQ